MSDVERYNKVTVGFVVQRFVKQGDKFVCKRQDFIGSDEVSYENVEGDIVDIDTNKEQYQHYNMEQPGKDYYFLFIWGCVETQAHGPYDTKKERDIARDNHEKNEGSAKDMYHSFELSKGAVIDI